MKRLAILTVAIMIGAIGCGSSTTSPSSSSPTKPTLTADLRAANEVPPITGPEATGSGTVVVTLDTTKDSAGNITSAVATFVVNLTGFPAGTSLTIAHIHEGANTCACPVVVNTTLAAGEAPLTNGVGAFVKAGITVTPEVAQRLLANPAAFYFNVHSVANPGGVARGQLTRVQ